MRKGRPCSVNEARQPRRHHPRSRSRVNHRGAGRRPAPPGPRREAARGPENHQIPSFLEASAEETEMSLCHPDTWGTCSFSPLLLTPLSLQNSLKAQEHFQRGKKPPPKRHLELKPHKHSETALFRPQQRSRGSQPWYHRLT